MKRRYLITIDGLQMIGWNKNITLSTLGDFKKDNDKYYISYNNYDENNNFDITLLEIDADKKVSFTRNGNNASHLVIERDQKNYSHLRTDYGDAMLGIKASRIRNDLNDSGGRLSLTYAMDMNANELFHSKLDITVKEL